MKKLTSIILVTVIISIFGYQYFSKPAHSCEQIIEPYYLNQEASDIDRFTKFTIEQHVEAIKSPEIILRAIHNYRLDELYSMKPHHLQEEIARALEINRISDSNKISIKVGADTKEKAEQLVFVIVASYDNFLREIIELNIDEFVKNHNTESKSLQLEVSKSRKNLQLLDKKFARIFIDPNPHSPSAKRNKTTILEARDNSKLTPEQYTQYAIAKDQYLADVDKLETMQQSETLNRAVTGFMDPIIYHNYAVSEKVYTAMSQRTYKKNQ